MSIFDHAADLVSSSLDLILSSARRSGAQHCVTDEIEALQIVSSYIRTENFNSVRRSGAQHRVTVRDRSFADRQFLRPVGTSRTISPASRSKVHRARSSGGLEHATATSKDSSLAAACVVHQARHSVDTPPADALTEGSLAARSSAAHLLRSSETPSYVTHQRARSRQREDCLSV